MKLSIKMIIILKYSPLGMPIISKVISANNYALNTEDKDTLMDLVGLNVNDKVWKRNIFSFSHFTVHLS